MPKSPEGGYQPTEEEIQKAERMMPYELEMDSKRREQKLQELNIDLEALKRVKVSSRLRKDREPKFGEWETTEFEIYGNVDGHEIRLVEYRSFFDTGAALRVDEGGKRPRAIKPEQKHSQVVLGWIDGKPLSEGLARGLFERYDLVDNYEPPSNSQEEEQLRKEIEQTDEIARSLIKKISKA